MQTDSIDNIVAEVPEKKVDALGRAYSTGRRKSSVARVWIKRGSGKVNINGKDEMANKVMVEGNIGTSYPLSISKKGYDIYLKQNIK